ncbi:MAG: PorT family protein [Oligoflexia bacterium]|nr:PorT family protein [Oligoflexia bacterium]
MKMFLATMLTLLVSSAQAAPSSKAAITDGPGSKASQIETNTPSTASEAKISRMIPHVGLLLSSYTGIDGAGAETKTGFEVGALVDLGRQKTVFETGVLYRQMGAYSVAAIGGDTISSGIEADYLSVPLNAKYYVHGQNQTSLVLKGGIAPSYLISQRAKSSNMNGLSGSTEDTRLSRFDLGLIMGVGGRLLTGEKSSLLLEATYYRGLTNAFETTNNAYNAAFGFSAGFAVEM